MAVYGSVTSGTQWRFLQLIGQTLTIDLTDYPLPPVEKILSLLVWIIGDFPTIFNKRLFDEIVNAIPRWH